MRLFRGWSRWSKSQFSDGNAGLKKGGERLSWRCSFTKRWEAAPSSARVCVAAVCLCRRAATGLNIGVVIQNDCFFLNIRQESTHFSHFCHIVEIRSASTCQVHAVLFAAGRLWKQLDSSYVTVTFVFFLSYKKLCFKGL